MTDTQKKVLITGVNGQDGQYLAELLVRKNYQVFGTDLHEDGIKSLNGRYSSGSISDSTYLTDLILKIEPDYIYNFASVSQVSASFSVPEKTFAVNLLPVIRILELLRGKCKSTRFLQATSSEIFGEKTTPPFNEESLLDPLSPYAVSKAAAYFMVKTYRKAYGVFASNAILFNHTSPRHAQNFIIAKIIKGLVEVKFGSAEKLMIGNIDIERDWGFAGDYVKAMNLILSCGSADDFVIGTGRHLSIKSIVQYVLNKLDLSYNKVIEIDPKLFRPNDPKIIYSDPSKIKQILGWHPEKRIEEVLDMMIEEEMKNQKGERND